MQEKVYKRGTLLIISGTSNSPYKKHLFIVCNDPCPQKRTVIVPMCSVKNQNDDLTCVIEPYEHPFVKRKTFISYKNARVEETRTLEFAINEGLISAHEGINAQTFLRVRNGICKSKLTPNPVKKYMGCA